MGQVTRNANIPQGQESNVQPAPSQADPFFTLVGNNPGVNAMLSAWSSLLSEVRSLESTLLARFDALLSMGFGAYTHSDAQDTLMRDLLFAFRSAPHKALEELEKEKGDWSKGGG